MRGLFPGLTIPATVRDTRVWRIKGPQWKGATDMVVLRFKRFGRRHEPFFRLGAVDSRCPRDGRVIEELGWYAPDRKDPTNQFKFDLERVKYWLSMGAQPSETVASLLRKAGVDAKSGTKYVPAPAIAMTGGTTVPPAAAGATKGR